MIRVVVVIFVAVFLSQQSQCDAGRSAEASATAAVNASAGFTVLILTKYVNAYLPQMI